MVVPLAGGVAATLVTLTTEAGAGTLDTFKLDLAPGLGASLTLLCFSDWLFLVTLSGYWPLIGCFSTLVTRTEDGSLSSWNDHHHHHHCHHHYHYHYLD